MKTALCRICRQTIIGSPLARPAPPAQNNGAPIANDWEALSFAIGDHLKQHPPQMQAAMVRMHAWQTLSIFELFEIHDPSVMETIAGILPDIGRTLVYWTKEVDAAARAADTPQGGPDDGRGTTEP